LFSKRLKDYLIANLVWFVLCHVLFFTCRALYTRF
jgi:hypothetical protein